MSEHREEFEPFIEDDIPFDRYSKYNMNTSKYIYLLFSPKPQILPVIQ